jgi:hypothetical protein
MDAARPDRALPPQGGQARVASTRRRRFLAHGQAVIFFADDPDIQLLGLAYLSAGLLFLAEMAWENKVLVGLLWMVCGTLGLWKQTELVEWDNFRPWTMICGFILACHLSAGAVFEHDRLRRGRHRVARRLLLRNACICAGKYHESDG